MIIKAGTYRFNDVLTLPSTNIVANFDFYFVDEVIISDVIYIKSTQLNPRTSQLNYALQADNGSFRNGPVYFADSGWINSALKIIIIKTDQTVDDTFGTWFTSNTTMLIKAGTYRWNDTVDVSTEFTVDSLPFVVSTDASIDGVSLALECFGIMVEEVNGIGYGAYYNGNITTLPCYTSTNHWNNANILLGNDYPQGYGQIITITEDTYVPTNFGLWANENWQPYGESKPAVEISYKDKVITLKAGQTARLHNADGSDFGFTEDLVIKANEVETLEPNLGEATFTERRVYTAEDDFLDGYSKVTVAVPHTPKEVVLESQMTALLETADVGSVFKYTGETGTYENGALYIVEAVE